MNRAPDEQSWLDARARYVDSQNPGPEELDPFAGVPQFPGAKTADGDWRVVHRVAGEVSAVYDGHTRDHAERLAAWSRWRSTMPGGQGGSLVVEPMPDRIENFRGPGGDLHFGAAADDPNGVRDCMDCGGAETKGKLCSSCHSRDTVRAGDHRRRHGGEQSPATAPAPTDHSGARPGRMEWGIAGFGPGGAHVRPTTTYEETKDPLAVYRREGQEWVMAATGWPLSGYTHIPTQHNNGGNTMANQGGSGATLTGVNTGGADIVTVADLRAYYQRGERDTTDILDSLTRAAAKAESQAAAAEAALGALDGDQFDNATINEANAVWESWTQLAEKLKEALASAEAVVAASSAALRGLNRHLPMEEAVQSAPGGVAKSTASYAPS